MKLKRTRSVNWINTWNDLLKKYESETKPLDPMGFVSVKRELNTSLQTFIKKVFWKHNELMPFEKLPDEITVVSGRVGEQKQVSSLFVQKSAYQFAEEKKTELEKHHSAVSGKSLSDFLSKVSLI